VDAKEYLSQALWLDQSINNKLEHIEQLKSLAQMAAMDFPSEGEDIRVKIIDFGHEINFCIDQLIDLKREILETISQVSDASYQLLLEMRYMNGKSWDDVASYMGYDRSTIFRIHGKALKEIAKLRRNATTQVPESAL